MQVELKIKEILADSSSVKNRVGEIQKFMIWNGDKLTSVILKYGTHNGEQRGCIINEFWGKPSA